MPEVPARTPRFSVVLLVLAALASAVRLWSSFCLFPLSGWNAIRLAPSFMLRHGVTPYPGLAGGPVTTWIYGPVPLLLNLPATLASHTDTALLIADVINLAVAVLPAAVVIFAGPPPRGNPTGIDRGWALLLCLAFWPGSSLQYIQADNTAIAFGLLANVLLLRANPRASRPPLLAAACAALAVWSKQTALGLVIAQLLWLLVVADVRAAARYALACAAFGVALGAGLVAWFGFDGLWLNLVSIPGRLPYWPSALDRTLGLLPHLAGYVVLPAVLLAVAWRAVRRNPVWLLPALSWLCLLPTSMISIYKIGGTANSLTGFLFLLPVAALAGASVLGQWRPRFAPILLGAGVVAVVAWQMALVPLRPLRPITAHLRRADYLAHEFPQQIYFPWNPIVTYFSDHRFYHAEDGLYARYTAQLAPPRALAFRDLPEHWCVTAFQSAQGGWGIIEHLQPADAHQTQFGEWTLYSWSPPSS